MDESKTSASAQHDSSDSIRHSFYFHCRSYSPADVEILLNVFPDTMIGICGNVTYKNAHTIRDSLDVIPLTNLVLETDAPYLSPVPYRGQQNEPSLIPALYAFVAEQKKISPDELVEQMKLNRRKLRRK